MSDAQAWDGQTVALEGWAQDVLQGADGVLRLTLVDGSASVAVRIGADADVREGERLSATGRLSRTGGSLTLLVDASGQVRSLAQPTAERPSWSALADDPTAWTGRRITLDGAIDRGRFVGEGATLQTGSGPWPRAGLATVTGLLRYEPECLCHVLDADGVRPWTP